MKRWLAYGLIIALCLSIGALLYGDLQQVAQKQENQADFQQRLDRMPKEYPPLQSSSPAWSQLPETLRSQLSSLGFSPASPQGPNALTVSLPRLNGTTGSLEAHADEWLLINFWATWCPPCRFEMPSMNQLAKQFKDRKFTIIAINLQENESQVRQFVDSMELTFPIWLDRKGTVANRFYVTGVPETWLIAPGGRPVGKMNGSRDWNAPEVIRTMKRLLEESR